MKVREIMTERTAFCGLETSLSGAVQTMKQHACGFLPVVGEGGNVIGVITDRDISIAVGTRAKTASELLVKDVVLPRGVTYPKLFACTQDEDVRCALKTMRRSRIRRLPVVDREGVLLGVLALDDLARIARPDAGRQDISYQDVVETYRAVGHLPAAVKFPPAA